MIPSGAIAYANARMRACKSRLLTHPAALPLFAARDAAAVHRAVTALELDAPLRRVLRVYATAMRGYPCGQPLFRALLQRHEIENVKLLWRATLRRRRVDLVAPLWIELGSLASVSIVDASSVQDLARKLARTPYGPIAGTIAHAHGSDGAAAELAFDRWMSWQLREEARRLPRRESIARRLVELIVEERDAEIVRRGTKWYGLASVSGTPADETSLRQQRLRWCRRAFTGSPFLIAPAVAVILLAEEEMRAVRAFVERQGDSTLDSTLQRALAGSQLGA